MTRRMLARMFRFRHERTRRDLARHAATAGREPLRIAITGASARSVARSFRFCGEAPTRWCGW
jgi:hypothetical protein